MQQQFDWLLEPAGAGSVAGRLQSISNALTSAGVTKEDWKAAFGDEISVMAAWPANAQLPNAAFTVAVRDSARARKIAEPGARLPVRRVRSPLRADGRKFLEIMRNTTLLLPQECWR